jgi:hypothetical protein
MATFVATNAGQTITSPWPQKKNERITAPRSSDLIRSEIEQNVFLSNFAAFMAALGTDSAWTTMTPSRGTTVTLATSAATITIAGVPVLVAATTAQAIGALGTIPASTWGVIAIDAVAAGTISFVSGAANYTTGYTTEALAIAAMPAKTAAKARTGYFTVLASASAWVAGTDALAGGSGGNPATTTNYYPIYGVCDTLFWTANQIADRSGTVLSAASAY